MYSSFGEKYRDTFHAADAPIFFFLKGVAPESGFVFP